MSVENNGSEQQFRFIVGLLELVVSCIVLVGNFVLFVRNWKSPWLISRGRLLTLIVYIGSSLVSLEAAGFYAFGDVQYQSFWLDNSITQTLAFITSPYLLKAYLLVFKYEICKYISRMIPRSSKGREDTDDDGSKNGRESMMILQELHDDQNWYVQNKWLLESPWPALGILTSVGALLLSTPFFACFVSQSSSYPQFGFYLAYCMLTMIIGIFLACKLSNFEEDVWGIQRELKLLMIESLVLVVIWQIWTFALHSQAEAQRVIMAVLWVVYEVIQVTTITNPLISAEKQKRIREVQEAELDNRDKDLAAVVSPNHAGRGVLLRNYLQEPKCYQAFYKHVQAEFSIENLAFWNICQKYQKMARKYRDKKSPGMTSVVSSLMRLVVEEYISPNGHSCVNIPHVIRNQVQRDFQAFRELVNGDHESPTARASGNSFSIIRGWGASIFGGGATSFSVEHISPKSSAMVNVKVHSLKEEMKASKKELFVEIPERYLTMFDVALEEVLTLMEKDSFFRFKRTEEFRQTLPFYNERKAPREEQKQPEQIQQPIHQDDVKCREEEAGTTDPHSHRLAVSDDQKSTDLNLTPSSEDVLNSLPKW